MNILLEGLPDTVTIGEYEYPIETDFRAGIAFELAVQRGDNSFEAWLKPWFKHGYPYDLEGAIKAAVWFYSCGKTSDITKDEKAEKQATKGAQAYSFEVDADALLSSFWQAYRIDLSSERLHWWVFRMLMNGLPEECEFSKRIYYRTCNLKDLPKKERERIVKIRNKIAIEKTGGKMTLAERNTQMREYVKRRHKEANKSVVI